MADATRYYYSPEEIDRASSVTVLDYLLSGKGAYSAYETGKYDRKTGEPIYTCDYDGVSHDTVKITSQGFKHWASGRKGCYYAYEFLRDYCGYSDLTKVDKMKIYEEIFLAVFGEPAQTWEEHVSEGKENKKTVNKPNRKETELSNTKYFSAADLSLLSERQLADIKPEELDMEVWEDLEYISDKYKVLISLSNDSDRAKIRNTFNKELPAPTIGKEVREFNEPERSEDMSHIYSYLTKTRGISDNFFRFLVSHGYIYETKIENYIDKDGNIKQLSKPKYNLVVTGKDESGTVRYAYKRETWDLWDKFHCDKEPQYRTDMSGNQVVRKPFKGEAEGSDKRYSWKHENENSTKLFIFEAPIDAFSYMNIVTELHPEAPLANYMSLGGVSTVALEHFLDNRPDINLVYICLDNDYDTVLKKGEEFAAGPQNAKMIQEFLTDRGIESVINLAPAVPAVDINNQVIIEDGVQKLTKDFNEYLRTFRAANAAREVAKKNRNLNRE